MPTSPPLPDPTRRPVRFAPEAIRTPRVRRARLPGTIASRSELRPAVAVSAEVSPDGRGGEWDLARRHVLRWLEAHVGPLPPGFDAVSRLEGEQVHVERHRSSGAIVRAVEREAGSSRYFGVSLEAGAFAGLAAWKAIVILFRTSSTTALRAMLFAPRRRLDQRDTPLWVPGIVRWLARSPGLTDYGWRLLPAPWIIENEEGVEGLIHLIGSRQRTRPVFATGLGPRETNPESAPVDLWDLAHRTVGLAHVAVLTGPMTYALTDRVGRKYSVFGNAVRTYRPGCVIGDRAAEHPMALPETVRRWRTGGPHDFAVFLTREAARASVLRQGIRDCWFPESVEAEFLEAEGLARTTDPIGEALRRPTADGDAMHPLGAGEDTGAVQGEEKATVPAEEEAEAPAAEARAS
ncbi:MAG: hypothetical protein F4X79_08985 [Acidobacteria bacterium]|nr:hypothetical protein [Acidobacteriota bacterium]